MTIQQAIADPVISQSWSKLASLAIELNPFAEPWYQAAAVQSLAPNSTRQIAACWEGETLLGLIPLMRSNTYAGLPLVHLQNWVNHNAFLGSPLVAKGRERDFWHGLLSALDNGKDIAFFLHLTAMRLDGPVAVALEQICNTQRRRFAIFQREERALLEHGLSPEAYLEANMRGKKRKELRRLQSRLSELGDIRFERSFGDAGLADWIEEFLALERRGWKGANGSALDCAKETRELFRNALFGAAKEGKLELLVLRLDGRAIAMLVNFITPPGAFSFKTAFDEDYARFSPGVLLQIHNLALLEREDIAWCDSCAAQNHPMIDSIWSGRRSIGRYSIAIGGPIKRAAFTALLAAEQAKGRLRRVTKRNTNQNNGKSG
jgi:CelD/BcsL family acetyltransferase involved in cellulose biosynthesis